MDSIFDSGTLDGHHLFMLQDSLATEQDWPPGVRGASISASSRVLELSMMPSAHLTLCAADEVPNFYQTQPGGTEGLDVLWVGCLEVPSRFLRCTDLDEEIYCGPVRSSALQVVVYGRTVPLRFASGVVEARVFVAPVGAIV